MLSVVFKQGEVEVAEDTVSISDNFKHKSTPHPGAAKHTHNDGRARIINASPAVKKDSNDNSVVLEEEPLEDILEPNDETGKGATPYVFPSLAEKESQYEEIAQEDIAADEPPKEENSDVSQAADKASLSLMCEEMVQKAVAQASAILEDAHARAQTDYQRLMADGRAEIEKAKAEGYEEGTREGTLGQVANIRGCIEQLEQAVGRIEGRQEEYFIGFEQDIKWLALEICEKVLTRHISEDELNLYPLITEAVSKQRGAASITLEISDDAPLLLQKLRDELEKGDDNITVAPVTAPQGTCRIQTPEGFIDASLYRQIDNLRDYFSATQL